MVLCKLAFFSPDDTFSDHERAIIFVLVYPSNVLRYRAYYENLVRTHFILVPTSRPLHVRTATKRIKWTTKVGKREILKFPHRRPPRVLLYLPPLLRRSSSIIWLTFVSWLGFSLQWLTKLVWIARNNRDFIKKKFEPPQKILSSPNDDMLQIHFSENTPPIALINFRVLLVKTFLSLCRRSVPLGFARGSPPIV